MSLVLIPRETEITDHIYGNIILHGQTSSGGSNGSMRVYKRRPCLIEQGGGVHERMASPKK